MYGYKAEEVVGKANSDILRSPEDMALGIPLLSTEAKRTHALMLITIGASFLSRSFPTLALDTLLRQV